MVAEPSTAAVASPQHAASDASSSSSSSSSSSASSLSTSDASRVRLYAYIYARVAMDTLTVRRALQRIRQPPAVTVDTLLDGDERSAEEPLRAGAFAVRYLLFRYYKKQLAQIDAPLERTILNLINAHNRAEAIHTTALSDVLSKRLLRTLTVPSEYQDVDERTMGDQDPPMVLCGGSASLRHGSSGSSSSRHTSNTHVRTTTSGTRQVHSCVEGLSIRCERKYFQRIRTWSLNVDATTLVDAHTRLRAEQFALSYVHTDRCKRTENTRRSKNRRRQLDAGASSPDSDSQS